MIMSDADAQRYLIDSHRLNMATRGDYNDAT